MIKCDKKILIIIQILFLISYIISFVLKRESNGLLYGLVMYILFFNHSKITKHDYICIGFLVIGCILDFINIFYNNIYLNNTFSIIISIVIIFTFIKKDLRYE